ncbi:hypothetical protein KEM09_15420 [Carboxylicivirga mesophila]|uniref:AsmA-like C-terminal domain-containing protein n=1 Tax=Carboxylicivirga mesophila TaxID=1166478 RepID=A0ABS5KD03_9BACT|nr:AsmA-like C-terminal region-containing protein [Carboxylicivirga mesophila]MBS2212809.1 hypothetical protein [Carboxylicivirga mesophila]
MKRLKHILAYLLLVLLGLILSLILIAELAETHVTKLALKQINANIDATISVGEVDFSLIKGFPDAMVEFNDVSIFTSTDTMAQVERAFISVEMRPLFNSEFNITEVAVEGGMAYYKIDSLGKTNFDVFLVPSEQTEEQDSTASTLLLSLKHLELTNLFCSYTDVPNNINACLYIDNGLSVIYIDEDNTKASFKGQLRANNCRYPATNLHLMDEIIVEADVAYFNELVTINALNITSDGLQLSLDGEIKNQSSLYSDIHLSSSKLDLAELKKYIPDSLFQAYEVRQLKGVASFSADVKGEYNDSIMPRIDARFNLSNGQLVMGELPEMQSVQLAGSYTNGEEQNNATTQLVIDKFYLASGGSWANVKGQLANLDRIKFSVQSDVLLNLSDVVTFVPDSMVNCLEGQVRMQMATNGIMPDSFDVAYVDYLLARTNCQMQLQDLNIGMDSLLNLSKLSGHLSYQPKSLKVDSLKLQLPDYKLKLTNANLLAEYSGELTNIASLGLRIEGLDVQTAKSHVKGHMSFNNPERPACAIDADAAIDLAEMKPFAPDSLITNMSGAIYTNLHSAGNIHLDSIADDLMRLLFTSSRVTTRFEDVQVATNDEVMQLQALNGTIKLVDDSIGINKVSGELAGITFDSDSTLIRNFYKAYWLNQPDTVKVDGYFNFGDIDYVVFEPLMAEEPDKINEPEANAEPANYRFAAKGKVTAKSFWYGNALFENLSALYNVSDSLYIADQVKFDAFKGTTNSSVKVEMLPDDVMKINFKNSTSGLDVNQLLYDFDDFMDYTDEVYISSEQLSGTFSTDNLNGQVTFYGDSLDLNTIKLTTRLRLEDGRLKDYPITEEMARDYKRPELKDIEFKTIDTELFSYQGAIYIPQTEIKTSAYDVALLGKQEFNLDCQYHLRFYLKEILRGKTDRIEKKQAADETKRGGGVKGLSSMFAIYKVKNGKTVKSTLEGKNSSERVTMEQSIKNKRAIYEFYFDPRLMNYNTGVYSK